MKRKISDSSGYASSKNLKLSDERECPNKKLRSQVIPNPVLSQSLRLGGTRTLKQYRDKNTIKSNAHKCKKVDEAPLVGTVVEERYRIDKFLGKGSFGFVCACSDILAPNLNVAIKFLKYIDDDYRTLNEISILKRISEADKLADSHCIQPIDLFRDRVSNQDCIVFPMYSCNLYEFLKRNHYVPFNLHEAKTIILQVCQAVNFIHSLHIIHTDLKPENIMLYDDSYDYCYSDKSKFKKLRNLTIKVIDFGMAVEGSIHSNHCQTRHYRAPEVILEQEWSFGIDMWSIGCILYELITGETIFMPSNTYEHLFLIEKFLGKISRSLVDRCSKDIKKMYFHKNGTLRKTNFDCDLKPLKDLCKYSKFKNALDLIENLLNTNLRNRIGSSDSLRHPFFCK